MQAPAAQLKLRSEFMRDAKRDISHALASGKALQFDAAREALLGVTHRTASSSG